MKQARTKLSPNELSNKITSFFQGVMILTSEQSSGKLVSHVKAAGRVYFSPEMVISKCFLMGQAKVSCLCSSEADVLF